MRSDARRALVYHDQHTFPQGKMLEFFGQVTYVAFCGNVNMPFGHFLTLLGYGRSSVMLGSDSLAGIKLFKKRD